MNTPPSTPTPRNRDIIIPMEQETNSQIQTPMNTHLSEEQMTSLTNKYLEIFKTKKKIYIAAAQRERYYGLIVSIPLGILILAEAILAFITASDMVSDDDRKIWSLITGIVGIIVVGFQGFFARFKFTVREEMFRQAAEQYEAVVVSLRTRRYDPNNNDFKEKLEKKLLKIREKCKYFPSISLIQHYEEKYQQ